MSSPLVRGPLAVHPAAQAFAAEVQRIHRRYASEVVEAFQLCPFLKDPDTAFGDFVVMLDRDLDVAAGSDAAAEVRSSVAHLVYPCADVPVQVFEKFAGKLMAAIRARLTPPPVSAVFHPGLSGDENTSHRMIGLLRRAPDPFVQLVPEGLHQGGTVFAGSGVERTPDNAEVNFGRLASGGIGRIAILLADIRRDRDASYAPFLEALRGPSSA